MSNKFQLIIREWFLIVVLYVYGFPFLFFKSSNIWEMQSSSSIGNVLFSHFAISSFVESESIVPKKSKLLRTNCKKYCSILKNNFKRYSFFCQLVSNFLDQNLYASYGSTIRLSGRASCSSIFSPPHYFSVKMFHRFSKIQEKFFHTNEKMFLLSLPDLGFSSFPLIDFISILKFYELLEFRL